MFLPLVLWAKRSISTKHGFHAVNSPAVCKASVVPHGSQQTLTSDSICSCQFDPGANTPSFYPCPPDEEVGTATRPKWNLSRLSSIILRHKYPIQLRDSDGVWNRQNT
mmetsp:Transcript_21837/g.34224  ORF Transcript_21837/g.34224 Transcript_21837/m.34224 type:complete len:108 (-) Transcript_21837:1529-1852(-)